MTSVRDATHIMDAEFPWIAPRVMLQYLETEMENEKPTVWIFENYDSSGIWSELTIGPRVEYRGDTETSTNQYHKVMHAFYRWASATDDSIEQGDIIMCDEQKRLEWTRTREGINKTCVGMRIEVETK